MQVKDTVTSENNYIVFFDGVCNLCNNTIDFLVKRDTKRIFRYSPLQGKAAKELLPVNYANDLSGMVYYRMGKIYAKSSAALMIANDLGHIYKLAMVFWIVPRFIRDGVYNWVARNRYKWYGKKETCRLPTSEERLLFLD